MNENLQVFSKILTQWIAVPNFLINPKAVFWIVVLPLIELPLLFVKELNHLTSFSILGLVTVVFIVCLVVGYTWDPTLNQNIIEIDSFNWFVVKII